MITLKVALPPEWTPEQGMIQSTLMGRIQRNVGDQCTIKFEITPDYGTLRLMECDPDSAFDRCAAEIEAMAERMEMRDPNDPMKDLRKLSDEEGR